LSADANKSPAPTTRLLLLLLLLLLLRTPHRTATLILSVTTTPAQPVVFSGVGPPPVVSSCNFTTFLSFSTLLSQVNLTVKRTNKTKRRTQRK
jgi:hypothetical protein